MVLIERHNKTGENEWISVVVVLSACLLVPNLDGDVKWLVLAIVTLPVVAFEAFRKKVREPLLGIWDDTVFFYRRGKLVATYPLMAISDMQVESKRVHGEAILLHLADDSEYRFELSHCRRPLRRAVVKCLYKHIAGQPGLKLQQAA